MQMLALQNVVDVSTTRAENAEADMKRLEESLHSSQLAVENISQDKRDLEGHITKLNGEIVDLQDCARKFEYDAAKAAESDSGGSAVLRVECERMEAELKQVQDQFREEQALMASALHTYALQVSKLNSSILSGHQTEDSWSVLPLLKSWTMMTQQELPVKELFHTSLLSGRGCSMS